LVGATDLRVTEARFSRAEALVGETRSRLLPSLNANAEGGATKQSYNYLFPRAFAPQGWPDYGLATLRLDWELDFWGKNRAISQAAQENAIGVRFDRDTVAISTIVSVATGPS